MAVIVHAQFRKMKIQYVCVRNLENKQQKDSVIVDYTIKKMVTKEKAKSIMSKLNTRIEDIIEEYLDSIYKIVTKYLEEDITQKKAIEQIENLFYQTFEKVYKVVSQTIKENYKNTSQFNVKNILDLTYHSDGKTLNDRIVSYLEQDLSKLKLFEKLYRLLLNESRIIESLVIKGKLSRVASILVIECDANDCNFGCSEYEGEYPADENIPLPPYHPDCTCTYYYVETEDEDDINDLDLEVEEIK